MSNARMAQYRQSGLDRSGEGRSYGNGNGNGNGSDHVAIGVRASHHNHKQLRSRRLAHKGAAAACKISIGTVVVLLCFFLSITAFVYAYASRDKEINSDTIQDDDFKSDFLKNVSRIDMSKVKFGRGSDTHGHDFRYWDGDDRRRDEDYNEDVFDKSSRDEPAKSRPGPKAKNASKKSHNDKIQGTNHHGLYNEAGRNELKMYEEKYKASLKNVGQAGDVSGVGIRASGDGSLDMENEEIDIDVEYDDGIDSHDARMEEDEDNRHDEADSDSRESYSEDERDSLHGDEKTRLMIEEDDNTSELSSWDKTISIHSLDSTNTKSVDAHVDGRTTTKSTSRRKRRHRKFSSSNCELKFLNSTAQLVEPLESRKFSRFSLRYTASEEKPDELEHWQPRFAGHQTLRQREDSFLARDQKINCGFVKGPPGFPSTGFDLAEDDSRYVSRLSRKNVCFVMFMDETTLQMLSSEGQLPDKMGFMGLWKIVVVKNLPFDDMRRVGKIPKLLPHRIFPSARYSIWLDSKLRLQHDPLLILDYFLWRKGHEFAISNHYDRHCVWEEVAQNKKLNKYNHTIIDQQFTFYQADGLKRFNASDPDKLLSSNVPEGSFIIRAHTPMSNLFSCLWFNEVDRFTPRDQLSFAYTYQKLRKKNPTKPFYLNMFKDCERRAIAKLFHHRSEDTHIVSQDATE